MPLTSDALRTPQLSASVPEYDRAALRPAIVHIGVGGFHRSHLAAYVDDLCRAGHTDWAIVGSGVLPGDAHMAEVLQRQDHLYTLVVRGRDETDITVIGSMVDYIHAVASPEALPDRIADPATQIVSLTVTEGGYPVDDQTGAYRPTPATSGPDSAFGLLVAGLDARRNSGGSGLTVLSCDNVLGNGDTTRVATLGAAAAVSPALVEWIEHHVTFPNSMVDRITPATTDADRAWLAEHAGIDDGWPVITEPFRQWVVEDRFATDRLPLEAIDVIVTDDVEPYEIMKLRLLNASHSCLAYVSALLDIATVHEAMADPDVHAFVRGFLELEARPIVADVDGVDLDEYVDSLVERYSNPNVGDQIARLCLDGTAKFPKFLIPTVAIQNERRGAVAHSALALAAWCEYLRIGADAATDITLSADPGLDAAVAAAQASVDEPTAFLELALVFGPELRHGHFADEFAAAVRAIRSSGVRSALKGAGHESPANH